MREVRIGILVDYESPLARRVAGDLWSGISRAALGAGYTKSTAFWESLREGRGTEGIEGPPVHVFVVGQDRPDAVDAIDAVGGAGASLLYGVVVAVPERPSPLAGSLLYQGVGRITGSGVRSGSVEPALLHALPRECESYARRLLQRLRALQRA